MKRLKSILLATVAIAVVIASALPTSSALAESGSSSLSIAPKKSYVIDPGGSIKDTISVRNIDTSNNLSLSLSVIDFSYQDDTGTPKLMLDKNTEPTTWSLRPYMTTQEAVTIKANSSTSIPIKIDVPKNLGAGSYYSAIMYSTGAPNGGNVGLSASGVTLVFVTVPGQVKESLTLKEFGPYSRNEKKYTRFTMTEPQVMAYTLANAGNVTEAPVGSIKLKDMFGHTYTIDNVNPVNSLALIGQTRTFQACIKLKSQETSSASEASTTDASTCVSPGLWPGFYRASIDLYYGQNGNNTQEVSGNTFFFYLPLWFIVLVIILLLALALGIWRLVVAIRRKTNAPKRHKSSRMMRR